MKAFKYLLVVFILSACHPSASKKKGQNHQARAVEHEVDSLLMTKPGAVLVYPSPRQIRNMKKGISEDDYYTVLDDDQYYIAETDMYLDTVKAYRVRRESEGVMKFKTRSGKIYSIKLSKMYYGAILFNGDDKPLDADITDIQDDYARYMLKLHQP